jgi:hypothetical protein
VLIYSYINTGGNWENEKLCGNTTPEGRSVFTQFRVFPISTSVDITVYQHGKCFIFVNYKTSFCVDIELLLKTNEFCGNTMPDGRVFSHNFTSVYITQYQRGKTFLFLRKGENNY